MNIFGLHSANGWPLCEPLQLDYRNDANESHEVIAQRFIVSDGQRYACILICFRDGTTEAFTF